MRLPTPRGSYSESLIRCLRGEGRPPAPLSLADRVLADGDVQISLWMLYELHYRGFEDARSDAEWDPAVLGARRGLEEVFEAAIREAVREHVDGDATGDPVERLIALIDGFEGGGSVPGFLRREGSPERVRELLAQRSVLQLNEADPYSWAIPRLTGATKVALVELQFDEYGAGRPERLHQHLYARTMREVGLDDRYGAYVDDACPQMLAVANAATFFGLHRRLRGAAMGHLAAFESTSSLPSQQYAVAMRKAGFSEAAAFYFDEHAEADAVHEQLATRGVCGALVADEPTLAPDILLGAATCLVLDDRFGRAMLDGWGGQ